jgi:YVTN family beta-propeller protein
MKNVFYAFIVVSAFISCKKEKDADISPSALNGIFIINEGAFQTGTGSVSFYDRSTGNLTEDLFELQNTIPLGDVALSMKIYNGRGFIVVNNSQKVEVVSMGNFKRLGTINNFSSPRFFLPINSSKGYVTDWISNVVAVVNLNSFQIIKSIPTGSGPEQMVNAGNKVYVTNVGGFGKDSTLTVINSDVDKCQIFIKT